MESITRKDKSVFFFINISSEWEIGGKIDASGRREFRMRDWGELVGGTMEQWNLYER